jgi:hypothetical protein
MMSRGLIPLLAGIALVAVLIAGVASGFVMHGARQSAVLAQDATPTAQSTPSAAAHTYPPELAFLKQMTPQQRFDHMGPAQVTFYNPQGQEVVVNAYPGQVASVSNDSVTLNLNTPPGGTANSRTFTITPTTWVIGHPRQGSTMAIAQGDRVVVDTIGTSSNAVAIHGMHAMGPHGMMGGGYGTSGMMHGH